MVFLHERRPVYEKLYGIDEPRLALVRKKLPVCAALLERAARVADRSS